MHGRSWIRFPGIWSSVFSESYVTVSLLIVIYLLIANDYCDGFCTAMVVSNDELTKIDPLQKILVRFPLNPEFFSGISLVIFNREDRNIMSLANNKTSRGLGTNN